MFLSSALEGLSAGSLFFNFLVAVFMIFVMWKIYEKADKPGWAAIVPFYNSYVLCELGGFNGWMFLLIFVPFVNIVFFIILMIKIAENFGKGGGFAVGLILLSIIFFPILAFDDSVYQG